MSSSTTFSTHKTPDVQAWLGRHKRFTFHFTPTSASWLNQVETWFSILTRQAIRRGSFENVRVLSAAIERFTREWNAGAGPFTWVKTADEILAKAVRTTQVDSGARHWPARMTLRRWPSRCDEIGVLPDVDRTAAVIAPPDEDLPQIRFPGLCRSVAASVQFSLPQAGSFGGRLRAGSAWWISVIDPGGFR